MGENGEEQEITFNDGRALIPVNPSYRGKLLYFNSDGAKAKFYHVSKRKNQTLIMLMKMIALKARDKYSSIIKCLQLDPDKLGIIRD